MLATGAATVSYPTYPILLRAPAPTSSPVVTGGSRVGAVLSCSPGGWGSDVVSAFFYRAPSGFGYQWTRGGISIPGASTNTLIADSPGSYVCWVRATNHAGSADSPSADT